MQDMQRAHVAIQPLVIFKAKLRVTWHHKKAQVQQVYLKKPIVSHHTEQLAFLKMHQSNQTSRAIATAARHCMDHGKETLHLFSPLYCSLVVGI